MRRDGEQFPDEKTGLAEKQMKKEGFLMIDALFGLSVTAMCIWLFCYCQSISIKQENRAYEEMQTALSLLKQSNRLESRYLYRYDCGEADDCDFKKIKAGNKMLVLEEKNGIHDD